MDPFYADDVVTLYLGDALENLAWLDAAVLITDPPYGSDPVHGYGRRQSRNRDRGRWIAGDRNTDTRDAALAMWGDRPALVFGSPRMPEPPGRWDDRLVWDKREPGINGGPWRYTHELIFVRGPGWVRTDSRAFSILADNTRNGSGEKLAHVHAKPLGLMGRLIAAAPPGLIADPFSGSGSTLVACKQMGRRAVGVEVEQTHCATATARLTQDALDVELANQAPVWAPDEPLPATP